MKNKPLLIALLVSLLINGVLLFLLFKQYNCDCTQTTVTHQWTDTIFVKVRDVRPSVTVKVPEAYRVIKKPVAKTFAPTAAQGSVSEGSGGSVTAPVFSPCSQTVVYSDTTEETNAYRAVIEDTLFENRITGRRITFWNLTPKLVEHIEKTTALKERVRVYLGLSVGFEASYKEKRVSNYNIGPEVFITEPHGVLLGYGYDAKNNGHRLTFAYKIKLRK